jgi:hypothetical protein
VASEYDQRQFDRMIECIEGYEDGKLSLPTLVSSLEGLIAALENVTLPERNRLSQSWGGLEEVLAVGLDEGRQIPNVNDNELIGQTLGELRENIFQLGVSKST